jgi:hypothetical protein
MIKEVEVGFVMVIGERDDDAFPLRAIPEEAPGGVGKGFAAPPKEKI